MKENKAYVELNKREIISLIDYNAKELSYLSSLSTNSLLNRLNNIIIKLKELSDSLGYIATLEKQDRQEELSDDIPF